MSLRSCIVCCTIVLFLIAGCGDGRPKRVNVVGKVTLDGKPLEGAMVALQPIPDASLKGFARPANATTNAAGEFVPGTYGEGDGLPPGKYRVAIIKREVVGKLPDNYNPDRPEQFNVTYKWITPRAVAVAERSGLEVEVTKSGINPAVIDLKSVRPEEIEVTGPQARANEP
jgi:hypothetical protein